MTSQSSQGYGLALHTTSSQLGLSYSDFFQDNQTKTWEVDRELSKYLHQYLIDFILPKTWQDFKFLAVAKGPGSFTSTRIGMVTARTLAQQLNIPLFGISTLAVLAWYHQENYETHQLIPVQMKASRGKVYGAIYQKNEQGNNLNLVLENTVMLPEEWQQKQQDFNLKTQPLIASSQLGITASSLLELANYQWQQGESPHWSAIIPYYGMSVVTK